MTEISFFKEFRERAGFVPAIAVFNPIILTIYILFWHKGSGAFEFWLVGMGLTFLICAIAGVFMTLVIAADRRRRFAAARRAGMWEDAMPYDAARATAGKSASKARNGG